MTGSRLLLIAGLVGCLAACSGPDPAILHVEQIIGDLEVQRYGPASSRYRNYEELVLSPPAAPAWRRGMDHEDPTVREWAVDALARIGDPDDVSVLVGALDDPFRRVQEAAVQGLIRLAPEVAAEAFMQRLTGGTAMDRMLAAQGLAELGDPVVVPALIEQLLDTELESGARGVIAQSLARFGDASAASALADVALEAGADLQMRRNAGEALATLSGPEATSALRRLLEADDDYLRDLARRALER